MAKRYHQTKRDRLHESAGMWREHKDKFNDEHRSDKSPMKSGPYHYDREGSHMADGHYEGHGGRRRQEMMDSGMIHEDHNQIANLPQNVMIKPYPRTGPYMPENLDDTIRGVDGQIDYDDRKHAEHFYPKKV